MVAAAPKSRQDVSKAKAARTLALRTNVMLTGIAAVRLNLANAKENHRASVVPIAIDRFDETLRNVAHGCGILLSRQLKGALVCILNRSWQLVGRSRRRSCRSR